MKLHLTYSDKPTSLVVRGEEFRVKPYQIIVWVSLAIQQIVEWDERIPKIPAILDTGFNGGLAISRFHLSHWAGIAPESLGAEIGPIPNQESSMIRGFPARVFESQCYIRANRRRVAESSIRGVGRRRPGRDRSDGESDIAGASPPRIVARYRTARRCARPRSAGDATSVR